MINKQELDISIDAEGNVSINVIGSKGKKCLELTKDIENALGIVVNRDTKPQFYETESSSSNFIATGLDLS